MYEHEKETVLQNVSMQDVAKKIGLEVNRSGYARCPFHDEKTASMRVYAGREGWYCFGCHAGGDVIGFVMRYFELKFTDALKWLSEAFSLGLYFTPHRSRLEAEKQKRDTFTHRKQQEEAERVQQDAHMRWRDLCRRRNRLARWKKDMEPFSLLWSYAARELPLVEAELDERYEEMRIFGSRGQADRTTGV